MTDDPSRSLHDLPALRKLLETMIELARKRVGELKPPSDKPEPQTQYADPELVQQALARAKRVLALSPEKLREMPTTSGRIH